MEFVPCFTSDCTICLPSILKTEIVPGRSVVIFMAPVVGFGATVKTFALLTDSSVSSGRAEHEDTVT